MPCRPDDHDPTMPPSGAWPRPGDALEGMRTQVRAFDTERLKTLNLLRTLLDAPAVPAALRLAMEKLVWWERTTPVPPLASLERRSGFSDTELQLWGQVRDAEKHLCVARHSLLKLLPLLPASAVGPHQAAIEHERQQHLAHRNADCAAEIAALESQLFALVAHTRQAPGEPAQGEVERLRDEVQRLRDEVARLKSLTETQLLANRDFSKVDAICPRCARQLPLLSGMDGPKLEEVLTALGAGRTLEAIKHVRLATGLDLHQAKSFVECPHGPFAKPSGETMAPVTCPRCFGHLAPLPGATKGRMEAIARTLGQPDLVGAVKLVRESTA